MSSPEDIAHWMMQELRENDVLHQAEVVADIEYNFGDDFVYINDRGNLAIDPRVLAAFRKLSGDQVVWVSKTRLWRLREDWDEDGRGQ